MNTPLKTHIAGMKLEYGWLQSLNDRFVLLHKTLRGSRAAYSLMSLTIQVVASGTRDVKHAKE